MDQNIKNRVYLTVEATFNKQKLMIAYTKANANQIFGIVYLKPGALMRCYSFTCPDLGSSNAETIASISNYFNSAIKRLGDGWAVHFESRRQLTTDYPGTKWNYQLGFLIDSRRKDLFQNKIRSNKVLSRI